MFVSTADKQTNDVRRGSAGQRLASHQMNFRGFERTQQGKGTPGHTGQTPEGSDSRAPTSQTLQIETENQSVSLFCNNSSNKSLSNIWPIVQTMCVQAKNKQTHCWLISKAILQDLYHSGSFPHYRICSDSVASLLPASFFLSKSGSRNTNSSGVAVTVFSKTTTTTTNTVIVISFYDSSAVRPVSLTAAQGEKAMVHCWNKDVIKTSSS